MENCLESILVFFFLNSAEDIIFFISGDKSAHLFGINKHRVSDLKKTILVHLQGSVECYFENYRAIF